MKAILLFLFALAAVLPAQEVIESFGSRIEIRRDGKIEVTESIRVRSMGEKIRRGIYRDFPTLYRGSGGMTVRVPFQVVDVLRDGKSEPWRSENRENGVRIYIGSPDVFLPNGRHDYTIRYTTGSQVGFFADFDELYWNVTGNGWDFPILRTEACVVLPAGASVKSVEAYTGPAGAKGAAYRTGQHSGCDAFVEATAPLAPREGLTIAVTWPKGFVKPPSEIEQLGQVVRSNFGILAGVAGLVLVFFYFLVAWWMWGRDPERGVRIPLYEPPSGFGPADVRYVRGLGTLDQVSFAATILDLAVKGGLRIEQKTGGNYVLQEEAALEDPGDETMRTAVFQHGSPLELVQRNHQTVRAAQAVLAAEVKKRNVSVFSKNTQIWVVGLLLTLVPLGISIFGAAQPPVALFMMVWLSGWSFGCAALSGAALAQWRSGRILSALPLTIFALPFLAFWVVGLFLLIQTASAWVAGIYFCGITMCVVFQHLLKRPSAEGQRVRDEIDGFRKYLAVAESERMNLENPPERTPELFEKFLPYALALDVSQQWAEQFADVFSGLQEPPRWYGGPSTGAFQPTALASALGSSLAGAISSASTAPGSSSGSSGGGASGGGGGGGGGGGW